VTTNGGHAKLAHCIHESALPLVNTASVVKALVRLTLIVREDLGDTLRQRRLLGNHEHYNHDLYAAADKKVFISFIAYRIYMMKCVALYNLRLLFLENDFFQYVILIFNTT
jgi:hypothetical protein